MGKIHLLDSSVIDKIAAGEAVERPASVVKELVENAVDAGASAVTVEIREGGIRYLRVTDNGGGIAPEDVRNAFLRHATSKIATEKDLETIGSLGFRGEALASIAAVSRVELITKRPEDLSGTRFVIEGGVEKEYQEVGAPDGTTIIVRDLFYNTPARQKFLKTAMTEASRIASFLEQLALSNPATAFSFIAGGQMKMQSPGNGSLKDVIFRIYGRSIVKELLAVDFSGESIRITGWIAKPSVFRSTRNYENYYVNGRCIKSTVIAKAVEDGYGNMLMQHCYPFTCLMIDLPADEVDVNVHPQKMEVRFSEEKRIYDAVRDAVRETVRRSEMIVPAYIGEQEKEKKTAEERKEERRTTPEPFERNYREQIEKNFLKEEPAVPESIPNAEKSLPENTIPKTRMTHTFSKQTEPEQLSFISPENAKKRRIIGQVFSTYWIIEFGDELLFIDQHAAHEKVLYERLMKQYNDKEILSQPLLVPVVITADAADRQILEEYADAFAALGFEIDSFGDTEYKISSVPYNLSGADVEQLFREMLREVQNSPKASELPSYVREIATEACKAAVKGGGEMSFTEAEALIAELMNCDDPYHCPHGRPTIISMTRREFEKKFRRIV